jgi:YggT family protein
VAIICILLQLFVLVIFVRIILSWFPPGSGFMETAQRLSFDATEWIMGPLRRVIPPVRLGAAALDLSPLIILFGISVLRGILCR